MCVHGVSGKKKKKKFGTQPQHGCDVLSIWLKKNLKKEKEKITNLHPYCDNEDHQSIEQRLQTNFSLILEQLLLSLSYSLDVAPSAILSFLIVNLVSHPHCQIGDLSWPSHHLIYQCSIADCSSFLVLHLSRLLSPVLFSMFFILFFSFLFLESSILSYLSKQGVFIYL